MKTKMKMARLQVRENRVCRNESDYAKEATTSLKGFRLYKLREMLRCVAYENKEEAVCRRAQKTNEKCYKQA